MSFQFSTVMSLCKSNIHANSGLMVRLFFRYRGAALNVHAKDTPIVPYSKSVSSESKSSYYSTKKAMIEAAQHQTARHPWCWKSQSLVLRKAQT